MEPPHQSIGRFKILREIAQGGMGIVYEAYDPKLKRAVAIKTVHDFILRQPGFADRFIREGQMVASLIHNNVVQIYDIDEDRGRPFLVMELVRGQVLKEFMETTAVSVPLALHILQAAGSALDYAHQKGIFHRDVKPANLMICQDLSVKLLDFGIAKQESIHMTRTGSMLVTPGYGSPEQLNNETVDGRSDQFSLGAVGYELLTGHKAFEGTLQAVVAQTVLPRRPRLAKWVSGFPEEAENVIERVLAVDPNHRFPSCSDFVHSLRFALDILADKVPELPRGSVLGPETPTGESRLLVNLLERKTQEITAQRDAGLAETVPMAAPAVVPPPPEVPEVRSDVSTPAEPALPEPPPLAVPPLPPPMPPAPAPIAEEPSLTELLNSSAVLPVAEPPAAPPAAEPEPEPPRAPDADPTVLFPTPEPLLSGIVGAPPALPLEPAPEPEPPPALEAAPTLWFPEEAVFSVQPSAEPEIETEPEVSPPAPPQPEGSTWPGYAAPASGQPAAEPEIESETESEPSPPSTSLTTPAPDLEPPPVRWTLRGYAAVAAALLVIATLAGWLLLRPHPDEAKSGSGIARKRETQPPAQTQTQTQTQTQAAESSSRDDADWEHARTSGTAQTLQAYLNHYPAGLHAKDAAAALQKLREVAARWAAAGTSKDPAELTKFVADFPDAPESSQARQLLIQMQGEESAWQSIEKTGDQKAIEFFLSKYPKAKFTAAAQARLQELRTREQQAWDHLQTTTDTVALEAFVKSAPNGRFSAPASRRLDLLRTATSQWKTLQSGSDRNALSAFVDHFPESPEAALARRRLNDLKASDDRDWTAVKDARDPRLLEKFLEGHADSAHKDEASRRAQELRRTAGAEWATLRASTDPARLEQFANQYPWSPDAGAAVERAKELKDAKRAEDDAQQKKAAEDKARQKTEEAKKTGTTPARRGFERNPLDGLEYAWIPAATDYQIGCTSECGGNDSKAQKVNLAAYRITRTEVTVRAYEAYTVAQKKEMPHAGTVNRNWANKDLPMVYVTAEEAQSYCQWIGGRLPREDEWEYAARGGKEGLFYTSGNEITRKLANYANTDGLKPVGSYPPNGFGLFEVMGNAAEWTAGGNVARGGHFGSKARDIRLSAREIRRSPKGDNNLGFRCVW